MLLDCAVIGGGPAGLNASLVLGRSRRKTILFDDNKPRNAVTSESHGFITRDGINPQELKRIAREELGNYPDVKIEKQRVLSVAKKNGVFQITAEDGGIHNAKKVILATGFKEVLPDIQSIKEFYGTSLFSCPFCDGWELRDRPLAVISENQPAFHLAKVVSNWTDNLIVCTNGKRTLSADEKVILESKGIKVYEKKIRSLIGEKGCLQKIEFDGGEAVLSDGGFVLPEWVQATDIGIQLGCNLNERGGIETDSWKKTTVEGLYACGDTLMAGPSQLILAAGEGSMAAISINGALIEEKFRE
ncbi:NAD(P)/FAD-dependent oxidoreductase [Sporosarcina aquimarina]|uniref:NAD(P)/FAD-dependent oxidoreductase n=1 Tax=Sporosarcina aquimarina TaxID=114975 RepID=A0ABU4G0I1_9BACL|nr:NAD(P)/FAD-dependent oxidoreductase [Sporosarcina aquimarina]MDW0110481.1 NAD(P)/FAD-dependent oxidoreductase [Sporosarcina aquimarina]